MRRILSALCAIVLGTASLCAGPNDVWRARWITKAQCNSEANSWIAFRKTVNISRPPSCLEAKIAADTKYWLWINGELVVFEGGLKRGPTPADTYYDVVDIAPYLKSGDNLISILLWHLGRSGFSHIDSGTAGLLFQAEGEGIEILSDALWQSNELPAFSDASTPGLNYRLPETSVRFDARRYPFDWYKGVRPGKLGSALELPYAVGSAPFGKLVRRPVPLWKVSELKEYESVEVQGDTIICTLPYNCQLTPYLQLDAPAGVVVTMQTDHAVVTGNECVRGQYVTCAGDQEYEHLCWMNGEKLYYIFDSLEGVDVKAVKYRESGYGCELSGSWDCDSPVLNEYWKKAQRTLYVDMRDTYYDCPDRERAQWVGDEVNELGMAFYMMSPSASALAVKGLKEIVGWQKPADGALYGPVPAANWTGELPMQTLAFIGWYGARQLAFWSGDYSFVSDIYDGVHRYLHETWQLGPDGLPLYRKGGWDWPDAGDNRDRAALLHPWYYLALKAEKEFALYLGKSEDAARDEEIMSGIESAFNSLYWRGDCYRSEGYVGLTDDRVQAMAVVSGLAGADKYPAILKVLARERHATTYMHRYVLEAFCLMGHPEMAQDLMLDRYPTIMKDDCSTLWEHWNHDGTNNHAWSGCGAIVMGSRFAGVEPLEPGFKRFSVCPQMGRLKRIETSFETPRGFISVRLEKKGKTGMTLILSVPDGSTALVPLKGGKGKMTELGSGTHTVKL